MNILRIHGPMDLRCDEVAEPACGHGEVKLKTEFCGLCGSDRPRLIDADVPFLPNTIGHEFCARVVEIGAGVTKVKVGDLAVVIPLIVCHECHNCLTGHYGQCVNKKFIGLRVPDKGAFAQYNVMPEANVLKVPDGMDPMTAALAEPMSVAIHALYRVGLMPGNDVAIVGAGMIGQLIIQCARLMGANRIHVFDVVDSALEEARRHGADYCYNTKQEGFWEEYSDRVGRVGVPHVLEVVGLRDTVALALRLSKTNGNVALVGLLPKPLTFEPADLRLILENEINLLGVWQSYDSIFPGDAWRRGLQYLHEDKIDVDGMVYTVITPDQILDACEEWKLPGKVTGKIVIDFRNF